MNPIKYKQFLEQKVENLSPTGYVNTKTLNNTLQKLAMLKKMVDEMIEFSDTKFGIDESLFIQVDGYSTMITRWMEEIEATLSEVNDEEIARRKGDVLKRIDHFFDECFNSNFNSSSSGRKFFIDFLQIKTIAANVKQPNLQEALDVYLAANGNIINEYLTSLKNNAKTSQQILDEVKLKVSKTSVSDYASVFGSNAQKFEDNSKKWLISGVVGSILFIILIFLFSAKNYFPIEITDANSSDFIRIGFTNLFFKLLFYGIILYFISFAFKQYSINKHQEILNKHRENALNSYKLFTQSMVGSDSVAQNALMIEVAKAIYENSQSTGYLETKNSGNSLGVVDITKNFIDSK